MMSPQADSIQEVLSRPQPVLDIARGVCRDLPSQQPGENGPSAPLTFQDAFSVVQRREDEKRKLQSKKDAKPKKAAGNKPHFPGAQPGFDQEASAFWLVMEVRAAPIVHPSMVIPSEGETETNETCVRAVCPVSGSQSTSEPAGVAPRLPSTAQRALKTTYLHARGSTRALNCRARPSCPLVQPWAMALQRSLHTPLLHDGARGRILQQLEGACCHLSGTQAGCQQLANSSRRLQTATEQDSARSHLCICKHTAARLHGLFDEQSILFSPAHVLQSDAFV